MNLLMTLQDQIYSLNLIVIIKFLNTSKNRSLKIIKMSNPVNPFDKTCFFWMSKV